MRCVLSPTPLDLIDFLFYFQGFEIIKLGFVGLELGVKLVLACLLLLAVRYSLHGGPIVASKPDDLRWLTVSFRSKRTTRPPLSPVAR